MSIGPSTHRLFADWDIQDFLTRRRQALFDMIDSLTDDQLCNTSMENVCRKLVREYSLDAPQIDESGIYLETPPPPPPAGLGLLLRGIGLAVESGSVAKSRTRFIFHVPFTGNPQLFHCRPRMTPPHPLHATVGDVELAFSYVGPRHDGNLIRMDFDRDLSSLKTSLVSIAQDVEEFNASLLEPVSKRIRARQEELPHHREIAKKLGVPTIRATDLVGTREPPTAEPDVASQPSPIPTAPEAPQPTSGVPELPHANDYSWVRLGDQKTRLPPNPARAVRFIYEEYVRTGHPEVDEKRVLKECGSQQKRLYEVLRHCNAWGSVVTRGTEQGTVELNFPKPVKTRSKTRKNP